MRSRSLMGVLVALSLAIAGCSGVRGEYLSLFCECVHCDDWDEEFFSEVLSTNADIASIYGCDAEYESLLQCEIDEGECDEDKANWVVEGDGSCTGSMALGLACMVDADCAVLAQPGVTCVAGACSQKVCSGIAIPCMADDECPGEYKCADEQKDLAECEDDGADDKSYVGGVGLQL